MNIVRGALLALALMPSTALAQTAPPPAPVARAPLGPVNLEAPIVTRREGRFHGKCVAYDAIVEPFVINNAEGRPSAQLVITSYIARNVEAASRPVLFVFNGGPISPSVPLHLGAFGPRRVAVPEDVNADLSNLPLVDNPYAPLDFADVVIFDVANTGYSRTLPGIAPESYFSNVADGQQLVELVREWSRRHGRVGSPRYLVGESYGTMRAAEAAVQLQATDMPVDGIVLYGQALNIIEYAQRRGNIISYAVSLPTLAATAWSHGRADRRGRTFDQFIRDSRDYGAGEYLSTLFLGDTAPLERRQGVARRLQEFTGLSAAEYLRRNLRVTKVEYQRLLIPGRFLDTNDARYSYPVDPANPNGPPPVGTITISSVWSRAFPAYLANELRAGGLGTYSMSSPVAGLGGWDWGPNKTPFGDWPYVAQLGRVFEQNPNFRVMVANGYTDTQTTIGAMDYLVSQSGWPRDRVRTVYYQGGHMFYTVEASLDAMMRDLRAMVTRQW